MSMCECVGQSMYAHLNDKSMCSIPMCHNIMCVHLFTWCVCTCVWFVVHVYMQYASIMILYVHACVYILLCTSIYGIVA